MRARMEQLCSAGAVLAGMATPCTCLYSGTTVAHPVSRVHEPHEKADLDDRVQNMDIYCEWDPAHATRAMEPGHHELPANTVVLL